jgi:hypothetical protein
LKPEQRDGSLVVKAFHLSGVRRSRALLDQLRRTAGLERVVR